MFNGTTWDADRFYRMHRMVALFDAAAPYPLTGFKSATIFVCKKRVTQCRYLELSVKAVNLITKLGELEPGEYNRCKLLTPKLMSFYTEHYEEIKETVSSQSESVSDGRPGIPMGAPKSAPSSKPSPATAEAKPSPAGKPAQAETPAQAEKPTQAEKTEKS